MNSCLHYYTSLFYLLPSLPMNLSRGSTSADAVFKIVIAVAVLIAAGALAYRFVVAPAAAPSTEQSSSASSVTAQVAPAPVATDTKDTTPASAPTSSKATDPAALQSCLDNATQQYNYNWSVACQTQQKAATASYQNCMATKNDESYCTSMWGTAMQTNANCTLPISRSNSLKVEYKAAQQLCYKNS